MLVSDKYKVLFVHIPKTGGSCIRKMMWSVDPQCYEYKKHHSILDEADANNFSDYFKFTVVRNSYELCASFYRFMTEKIETLSHRQEPVGMINLLEGMNLQEGQLTETKDSMPGSRTVMEGISNTFPVQMDWYSKKGKVFVDEVYIYEEGLDNQMEDLKNKINFQGSLLKGENTNYFGDYDWKKYYDQESIEYVERICEKDIQHFNFKFD